MDLGLDQTVMFWLRLAGVVASVLTLAVAVSVTAFFWNQKFWFAIVLGLLTGVIAVVAGIASAVAAVRSRRILTNGSAPGRGVEGE